MEKKMEKKMFNKVVTHGTIFHADDVFGVAMWKIINPEIKVIRTLKPEEYEADDTIIFDIGLGKYDHHQENKALRSDGTPYCGFGLMWRDYGYLLCPEKEAWSKVDQTLVISIDKADNGVSQNLLSSSIKTMNPNWNEKKSSDEAFFEAVEVAKVLLKSHVSHANAAAEAYDAVASSYLTTDHEEILVLDRYLPWADTIVGNEQFKNILFVIYPSQRGGWNVQAVPKEVGKFGNRMDFPKDWLGHADPERGITFAHTANFLIACNEKAQAINVALEAIEKGREDVIVASV